MSDYGLALMGKALWSSQQSCAPDLRAWEISTVFGVEAPAERDFTATVHRMKDGEVQGYGWSAGSLGDLLLLNQVCFIRDGWHAVGRSILNIKS